MKFDAVIIGGGAAGLFCAAQAGARGRKILVLEHNAEVGRKILISGGGRCNFTNLEVTSGNFVSQNPHFCKSALARYTPKDFIALVKKHRIEFYEKKLGQLFCRTSSRQIVQMLVDECAAHNVRIETHCRVEQVEKNGENFVVKTSKGIFHAAKTVVATGGTSFPKVGATDFGLLIARKFGLKIVSTEPSLVPLIFSEKREKYAALSGISLDAEVLTEKVSFRENILFTHRGLSGPAILQISNYRRPHKNFEINLLPQASAAELLRTEAQRKILLSNFLAKFLPQRFAEVFTENNFPNRPLNSFSPKELEKIGEKLNGWQLTFGSTEGFDKAEVMRGGVATDELSSQTFEAKKVRGLYFIGEVVDVTGWLGGYNFQWAWASADACGKAL